MILNIVARRIVSAVLTLLIVSVMIFSFAEIIPGDIAVRVLGRESTPQQRQVFRERLHLDRPIYDRFGAWLAGATGGDFGRSLVNDVPVTQVISSRISNTLLLAALAFALYVPISLLLALLGALFRGRPPDSVSSVLTLIGLSLPEFVVGTLLIFLFAVELKVLPAISIVDSGASFAVKLRALVLPALTLAIPMSAYAVRMLRDNLIDVLDSEYVRMATLKGASTWRVVFRHALPNALGPVLNVTAINLSYAIGGVVVVEQVFGYPGLGQALVDAVSFRDTPVEEAIILLSAAVYIAANAVADICLILLTPRLRSA